jgi:tetratricopeptide (TPR) repeat protein
MAGEDRARLRNEIISMSKTNWQLYIEPWEVLMCGHDTITEIITNSSDSCYNCGIMKDDLLTKQIRLWKKDSKLKFVNPVYEFLKGTAVHSDIIFWELPHKLSNKPLETWLKSQPLAIEPLYYKSFHLLSEGMYKEFLANAEQYLFHDPTNSMSAIMVRYYIAIVQCYVTKDMTAALRNAIICIAEKPLMAEFWCLLGDIYFHSKEFDKARALYDNAIILGQRRLQDDPWPMHLPKYKSYPEEMLERCKKIMSQAKVVLV